MVGRVLGELEGVGVDSGEGFFIVRERGFEVFHVGLLFGDGVAASRGALALCSGFEELERVLPQG